MLNWIDIPECCLQQTYFSMRKCDTMKIVMVELVYFVPQKLASSNGQVLSIDQIVCTIRTSVKGCMPAVAAIGISIN